MTGHPVHFKTIGDKLAPSAIIRDLVLNRVATRAAFIVYHDNSCTVNIPKGEIVRYEMCERLVMDNEGETIAYKVHHKGKRFVGINGDRDADYNWVSDPKISPDGKRVVYFADLHGVYCLVVNGQIAGRYPNHGDIVFTETGTMVFTVQFRDQSFVSLEGKQIGPYDGISPPIWVAGTNDVCFWALENKQWCLFRNTDLLDFSEATVYGRGVTWNQDGTSIGYWTKRGGQWFVGVDGRARVAVGTPLEFVGGPIINRNGIYGYSARIGDFVCAVVNDEQGDLYDAVGQIVFSLDGNNFAYIAQKNGREFLVLNGKPCSLLDPVSTPVYGTQGTLMNIPFFSPDGKRVAYIAGCEGAQHVAINDILSGPFVWISGGPIFVNKDDVVFGGVRQRKEYLVIDDKEFGPFDRIWCPERQEYYSIRWIPYLDPMAGKVRVAVRVGEQVIIQEIECPYCQKSGRND